MRIIQKLTDRKLFVANERLKRLGIKNFHLLRIVPKNQSFKDFCFGLKSGPIYTVTTVTHELAHAIQFGPELPQRILHGQFHFNAPTQVVIDHTSYDNPLTFNGMLREIETFAIEQLLNEKIGSSKASLEVRMKYYFDVCRFLPDELVFKSFCSQNNLIPFEHFKSLFEQFYRLWKEKDLSLEVERVLNVIEECRLKAPTV